MAKETAKQTYQAIGNREDLIDVVTNISPDDTPMLSSFGKVKAQSTYHEWLTDSLATPTANAFIEGEAYTLKRPASRTRLGNWTQIFVTPVEVSDTQRAVNTAGLEDEYAYQMAKKLKEHALDIEYAFVNGTGNSGASGTARTLKGVLAWITSNNITGTGTGSEALTEAMFNDCLQEIWEEGGKPDTAYANGYQKRKIAAFTDSATKYLDATSKEVVSAVNVYDSDFGRVMIKKHRLMATDKVAILQTDLWKIANLRPTKSFELSKIASSARGIIETELTLEAREEAGSGKITGLYVA